MEVVIKIENLYKEYRLGTIGYGTLREDLQSWWARLLNKPDPNSLIGVSGVKNDNLNRILALNNINLEIKQGDRLGIIGKNGAGKTTLLKILSRIASPTEGLVNIKGRIASLIAVGTGMHPEFTGRENIYLNGTILGLTKKEIDNKFDEIIDFSEVEQFIDTPIKRYSSGMKIRLGFSVAAHLDPDILVVDEVLSVGDANFKKKALKIMEDGSKEIGRTVLFVSHDLDSVKRLCSNCILIDNGEIINMGSPENIIEHYLKKDIKPDVTFKWVNNNSNTNEQTAYIKTAELIDKNGQVKESFDTRESIGIKFDFSLNQKNNIILPCINLFDNKDNHIFYAIDTDKYWHKPKTPGSYSSTAWIPGDLLSEKNYFLSILLISPSHGTSSIKHALEYKILSFTVFDRRAGDSAVGILVNNNWRMPMICPKLNWDH